MAHPDEYRLGQLAVHRGLISRDQLQQALRETSQAGGRTTLQQLLVQKQFITPRQIQSLLQMMGQKKTVGDYVILRELGRGGMGIVYQAQHQKNQQTYALKVLNPTMAKDNQTVQRFLREAQASTVLDHPNIVRSYEVRPYQNTMYISMEYVQGLSMEKYLDQQPGGILPEKKALLVCRKVAEALAAAYDQGIIHRDVKPENIIMGPGGEVKLTDFGLAKVMTSNNSLTQTGSVLGTPSFVSPEQALGKKKIDIRSDIYSLGITLFNFVTGDLPFDAESAIMVFQMHIHDPLPNPHKFNPHLSPEMVKLLKVMCAKKPRRRPANPYRLIEMIDRVALGEMPVEPSPHVATLEHQQLRRKKKRTALAAVLAILILVLGGGLGYYFAQKGKNKVEDKLAIARTMAADKIELGQLVQAQKILTKAGLTREKEEVEKLARELEQLKRKVERGQYKGALAQINGDLEGYEKKYPELLQGWREKVRRTIRRDLSRLEQEVPQCVDLIYSREKLEKRLNQLLIRLQNIPPHPERKRRIEDLKTKIGRYEKLVQAQIQNRGRAAHDLARRVCEDAFQVPQWLKRGLALEKFLMVSWEQFGKGHWQDLYKLAENRWKQARGENYRRGEVEKAADWMAFLRLALVLQTSRKTIWTTGEEMAQATRVLNRGRGLIGLLGPKFRREMREISWVVKGEQARYEHRFDEAAKNLEQFLRDSRGDFGKISKDTIERRAKVYRLMARQEALEENLQSDKFQKELVKLRALQSEVTSLARSMPSERHLRLVLKQLEWKLYLLTNPGMTWVSISSEKIAVFYRNVPPGFDSLFTDLNMLVATLEATKVFVKLQMGGNSALMKAFVLYHLYYYRALERKGPKAFAKSLDLYSDRIFAVSHQLVEKVKKDTGGKKNKRRFRTRTLDFPRDLYQLVCRRGDILSDRPLEVDYIHGRPGRSHLPLTAVIPGRLERQTFTLHFGDKGKLAVVFAPGHRLLFSRIPGKMEVSYYRGKPPADPRQWFDRTQGESISVLVDNSKGRMKVSIGYHPDELEILIDGNVVRKWSLTETLTRKRHFQMVHYYLHDLHLYQLDEKYSFMWTKLNQGVVETIKELKVK